jgi:signal transduction histidine kinase
VDAAADSDRSVAAAGAGFDRLRALLVDFGITGAALESAVERGEAVAALAGSRRPGVPASATVVGEAIAAAAIEREWRAETVAEICVRAAGDAARAHELQALAFVAATHSRRLFELPPRLAANVQLQLLAAFTGVAEATAWVPEASTPFATVGVERPTRRVRKVAAETIASGRPTGEASALLHGIPIRQWDATSGAVVVRARPDDRERALAHATETAVALAPVIEKETLLDHNAMREDALVSVSERRLARLGFDLHDGPLQDIAALAFELRLFTHHLRTAGTPEGPRRLAARADDFIARLAAIESEIRDLARSLESGRVLRGSLEEILRAEAARLAASASIDVSVSVTGRTDDLTPSQRIALVRLVEAALDNVSQHSDAQSASVTVDAGRSSVRVSVSDDGGGFEVEKTLLEAARRGRLGLVGMGERIRLLGGRLDITSRAGGPTVVAATIPRWRPPN